MLIAGGGAFRNSGLLQSAELFNPATDTFTALPASGNTELQVPRESSFAAPLPDGKALIGGGITYLCLANECPLSQSAELFYFAPQGNR